MIKITSKREGFWRAGVQHTVEPKLYPVDRFSAGQMALLTKEPMLTVEIVVEENASGSEDSEPLPATAHKTMTRDDLLVLGVELLEEVAEAQTRNSGPTVKALEEVLGESLTTEDRDQAVRLHRERRL